MIRRVFHATAPFAACAALALQACPAQAAPGLQDFPRASPVRYAGGPLLVSAVSSISSGEGAAPLQIAALGDTLAYGQAALQIPSEPAADEQAPRDEGPAGNTSPEALPMLAGLACIAAFVLARRTRS